MNIKKAYELKDAKISFVSLVDKAANKKRFLIKKAEDGKAGFTTYGRILKTDNENHYVTGIVYEPMVEDAHGNFMSEEEITKAAYYFIKKGNKIDLQHNFEPLSTETVVENWIAKSDTVIEGEEIKKGTWLMTVEVTNDEIWESIQKGEITGFSMGGVGVYSKEDVELDDVTKGAGEDKIGLLAKIAKAMGIKPVQKGYMAEQFKERSRGTIFWEAFYALDGCLRHYDYRLDKYVYETNEDKIRECLTDFNQIVVDLLAENMIAETLSEGGESVQKSLVVKAGKKMSCKNKEALKGIYDSLGNFIKAFDDEPDEEKEKEESEVTKSELEQIITSATEQAVAKALDKESKMKETVAKSDELTPEAVSAMVDTAVGAAVTKALEKPVNTKTADELTEDSIQKMIDAAVTKAVEPVLKARGVPYNLGGENIQKSEHHYMEGMF